jgi:hypothetical protein
VYIPQGPTNPYYLEDALLTLQYAIDAGPPPEAGVPDAGCSQTYSGPICNALCNAAAPVVNAVGVVGVAPTPTGGTILDGTYYLTAETQYEDADSGADGGVLSTNQQTIIISTTDGITTWQVIQSSNGGPNETITISAVAEGSQVYLTSSCPAVLQKAGGYSASGSQLFFYDQGAGSVDEKVYTKQ